jgi:putative chitinase
MSRENADYLLRRAREAGVTDPKELANFMGQMQIESGGYARMSENLHYSGKRLLEVFPGRNGLDNVADANRIAAGGPESIANAIYGGTWGKKNLGNTHPDDGWTYHGRGYVQLTGRANYARVGRELGLDLVNHPELAEDRENAARIAIHYWKTRVVPNGHQHDVKEATHDINGGYNHLAERRVAAKVWEQQLERSASMAGEPTHRDGHSNDTAGRQPRNAYADARDFDVLHLQRELTRLGYRDAHGHVLKADGDFGDRTKEAVQAFQRAHGIDPIGIVGPQTRAALRQAEQRPTPVDPAHPDHALHRQSMTAVQRLDASLGHHRDANSERLEASVTRLAKENGLTRIDHVVLGKNGNVFVVEGGLDDPARRVAHMPVQAAVATPAAESFRHMALHPQPNPTSGDAEQARRAQFEHHEGLRRALAP